MFCTHRVWSLCLVLLTAAAFAAPDVRIMPYHGAKFAPGQRFDVRVEFKASEGGNISQPWLAIDGKRINLAGKLDGAGGYTLRALSYPSPGRHRLTAGLSDGAQLVRSSADFEVLSISGRSPKIKNIILLLGDGMGIAHRTAGRIVRHGVTNGSPDGKLAMDEMPGTGWVSTHSLNSIITDSSPGMSCYSTGLHADNNEEGVFPDNTPDPFDNPRVEYLSEYLHRTRGMSLGIVTTADVHDATPAANAVHTADRGAGTGICNGFFLERQRTGLAVLMGGGRRWFLPQGTFGSSRSDKNSYTLPAELASSWQVPAGPLPQSVNLIDQFRSAGYTYVSDKDELLARAATSDKLLGLFAFGNMNVALDKIAKRRNPAEPGVVDHYHAPNQPMLHEMADAALKVLSKNKKGFYLMIEGAHIDKQTHAMDADRAIWDVLEFDRAVERCLQYARSTPDTLVIVLADHECGGFSLNGALGDTVENVRKLSSEKPLLDAGTQPAHQKAVATSEGAGFPRYRILPDGFPETPDPERKLVIGFGASGNRFENWLSKRWPSIDSSLPEDIKAELRAKGHPAGATDREGFFLRGQASRGSASHSAADIPVSVYSSGHAWYQFVGAQENTDVFFKLLRAAFGGYRRL